MTRKEFTERTMVEVSNEEFETIHEFYMNCECDKDEFCKIWCKMNPNRVWVAKMELKDRQEKEANKEYLRKWFDKWNGTQKFWDNYCTKMTYIPMSIKDIKAFTKADVNLDATLSEVHYKVGQYLGIYEA